MVDYSYVECSSACIQAMALFCEEYPDHERVPDRVGQRSHVFYVTEGNVVRVAAVDR